MRVGLALSSIVHLGVLLVAYLAFASPRLFDPTLPEAVTVDIVAADEMTKPDTPQPDPAKEKPELPKIDLPNPAAAKAETAKAEAAKPGAPPPEAGKAQKADQSREPERPVDAAPSDAKAGAAAAEPKAKPDPKRSPAASAAGSQPASAAGDPTSSNQMAANSAASRPDPSAPEAPAQSVYFPTFVNPHSWAMDFDFDAMAEQKAALTPADVEAFREHLDKCWKPPAAVVRAPNLKAVLRIALAPDGAMATEPILVGASASVQGPALVDTARRALMACQPFRFLPADKYSEWKILELNFTSRGLGG